jgi:uncharacterized protein (TIGR00251 family)
VATLNVKVVPGARRDRVAGAYGDGVKVQVSAPPEGGKANAAVLRVLAEALGIKLGQLQLLSGHGQPRKVVLVEGLEAAEIRGRLGLET